MDLFHSSRVKVSLERLGGKKSILEVKCGNGRELLQQLQELDDVAACATWLYKGFPLSPAASLPPKLELKEVLPWRNWKHWDVDDAHLKRLDRLYADPTVPKQHLRVNKYNPPDISILCSEAEQSTWLYASTYELALCLTSFAWRRLVLELMAFNDLRCSGSRACRVAQLRQMRQDLKMLAEQRDAAGLLVEGEDGATWPFGEASRIEMQEALSQKLMKQAKKDAEREEDPSSTEDAEKRAKAIEHSADLLCNLAVVLLLKPSLTIMDLQRAYAFLKQSLELDPAIDSQHFLQRVLRLLRLHDLEPEDVVAPEDAADESEKRPSIASNVTRLQRENTMFPDSEIEGRRCRQLQRVWLGTPSGRWLCKLRQKPLLIQMSLDALPEGCPDLSPNSVEAMLHISSMLHDEIHQVGSALAAVTWLLLYFGLRQKHPGFLALKRILSESPMPMCLQMVRQIANDKLEHHVEARNLSALVKLESHRTGGPRRNLRMLADLESLIMDSLASIRCDELFRGFHYGKEFEGLSFRNLPKPRLSHEDQLDILDRRAKLLEMILEIPPRTYTKHPTTDGTDGGLMNKPLTHNFFKDRVMRNKNSFLAKASRYGHPTRVEKDAS